MYAAYAVYTVCHAVFHTSLKAPRSRADRPESPKDLELSDLLVRSVRLTWVPGDDNNSPITGG